MTKRFREVKRSFNFRAFFSEYAVMYRMHLAFMRRTRSAGLYHLETYGDVDEELEQYVEWVDRCFARDYPGPHVSVKMRLNADEKKHLKKVPEE